MAYRDGRLPKGKGMFLWMLYRLAGGDMLRLADLLAEAGFSWVSVKIVDGVYPFEVNTAGWRAANNILAQSEYLTVLVPALESRGIEFHAWGYQYGRHKWKRNLNRKGTKWEWVRTPQARREAEVILEACKRWRPLSFTVNAEVEFKDSGAAGWADTLMSVLRDGLGQDGVPDMPVMFSSYRFPSLHPIPWSVFAQFIDAWCPQVYWVGARNPVEQLERALREHRAIRDLPFVPAGAAYNYGDWKPTSEELDAFDAACQADPSVIAANYWEAFYATKTFPWMWKSLSAHTWTGDTDSGGSGDAGNGGEPDFPEIVNFPLPVANAASNILDEINLNRKALNFLERKLGGGR